MKGNSIIIQSLIFSCLLIADDVFVSARRGGGGGGGGRSSGGRSGGGLFGGSRSSKVASPSSYPKQAGVARPPAYNTGGTNTGFSGSYPKQAGVQNAPSYGAATGGGGYTSYNRAPYGSYASAGAYGGGGASYMGGSSYANREEARRRISGGDMFKIGAGVAGGYIAGRVISNALFTPRYQGAYYTNSDRYYYDPQRDSFYDSRRQTYTPEPPCIKPNASSSTSTAVTTAAPDASLVASNVTLNSTVDLLINGTMPSPDDQWKMYAECLEYFMATREQMQKQYRGGAAGLPAVSTLLTVLMLFITFAVFRENLEPKHNLILQT